MDHTYSAGVEIPVRLFSQRENGIDRVVIRSVPEGGRHVYERQKIRSSGRGS